MHEMMNETLTYNSKIQRSTSLFCSKYDLTFTKQPELS